MNYPYNNEDMVYNYETHRYVLTPGYVKEKMGVDVEARYKIPGAIIAILETVSEICYGYMHEFNNTVMQDYIVAKTESGRNLIKQAMRSQTYDALLNGIFDTGASKEERELWISQGAKRALDNTLIPEIGTVITYTGRMCYKSPDETRW